MKKNISIVLLSLFLLGNACKNQNNQDSEKVSTPVTLPKPVESFNQIGQKIIDQLNKKIQVNKIISIINIAYLYHPKLTETEGNYTYDISSRPINDSTTELTLIETGLMDDSVKGIQTVFMVVNAQKHLYIIKMKENYQCYRGHQTWSAEKCN